jgi:hypothetical protein
MKVGRKMHPIEKETNRKPRKPGRPRAIGDDMVLMVLSLHENGFGYRAIACELERFGVFADWSTVRRLIMRWLSEKGHQNGFCSNSDTILPLGLLKEEGTSSQTSGSHS